MTYHLLIRVCTLPNAQCLTDALYFYRDTFLGYRAVPGSDAMGRSEWKLVANTKHIIAIRGNHKHRCQVTAQLLILLTHSIQKTALVNIKCVIKMYGFAR